jgi:DNA (cytosine-5)-methyltransferase 1
MTDLRVGSLFSGYGGLDMGVTAALGGSVAWHVEFDKAPSKILAHHWPDVPNYGDVTAVDWPQVEPVDVITGGSPCQDLSHAGKRQGMTEGTRSNLWVAMREAIAQLRPGLVVWENVRGAYSACADSEMGRCPRCVAPDAPGGHDPRLRALGRVLGDLSDLGYDCRWHGLRAADAGAPHGRFRVFVIAARNTDSLAWATSGTRQRRPGPVDEPRTIQRTIRPDRLHSPAHAESAEQRGQEPANLPARPDAAAEPRERPGEVAWGKYEPAVRRWERILGRPAPRPTELDGTVERLSPLFVEWMMGLPCGHVTAVPDVAPDDQLKALGNGVVPQQAEAAIRFLLGVREVAA